MQLQENQFYNYQIVMKIYSRKGENKIFHSFFFNLKYMRVLFCVIFQIGSRIFKNHFFFLLHFYCTQILTLGECPSDLAQLFYWFCLIILYFISSFTIILNLYCSNQCYGCGDSVLFMLVVIGKIVTILLSCFKLMIYDFK